LQGMAGGVKHWKNRGFLDFSLLGFTPHYPLCSRLLHLNCTGSMEMAFRITATGFHGDPERIA
jgi:hypothetical protein